MSKSDVSLLLDQVNSNQPGAQDRLIDLIYAQLRQVASNQMQLERTGHTLSPTALLSEVYLKLFPNGKDGEGVVAWENRKHFFSDAARAMRRILVDSARKKKSLKRGGNLNQVELDLSNDSAIVNMNDDQVLDLNRAMDELELQSPQLVRIVELKVFCGHSFPEMSEILGELIDTLTALWKLAKAKLIVLLGDYENRSETD